MFSTPKAYISQFKYGGGGGGGGCSGIGEIVCPMRYSCVWAILEGILAGTLLVGAVMGAIANPIFGWIEAIALVGGHITLLDSIANAFQDCA